MLLRLTCLSKQIHKIFLHLLTNYRERLDYLCCKKKLIFSTMQIFIWKDYICCCFVKGNSSIQGYSCLFQALIWTKRASVFWTLCTLIKNIQKNYLVVKLLKSDWIWKVFKISFPFFKKKKKKKKLPLWWYDMHCSSKLLNVFLYLLRVEVTYFQIKTVTSLKPFWKIWRKWMS